MKLPSRRDALRDLQNLSAEVSPTWDLSTREVAAALKTAMAMQAAVFDQKTATTEDTLELAMALLHHHHARNVTAADTLTEAVMNGLDGAFELRRDGLDWLIVFSRNENACNNADCVVHHAHSIDPREHAKQVIGMLMAAASNIPSVNAIARLLEDPSTSVSAVAEGLRVSPKKNSGLN